ncbi:MAG: class I SAM-dependent methyltransferase [Acidobacteriaceae bacterium]
MNDRRFPASQARRLEDPARLQWLPPAEVLTIVGVHAGEAVADVGAGTGYFTLPLAQGVGPCGTVYAVDTQSEMLGWIRAKIEGAGLANIELVHAAADATTLQTSKCDLFFLANVWHELEDRLAVLAEAARILKPEGRISILDWRPDVERCDGPPLEHRLAAEDAVRELRQAGFRDPAAQHVGQYSWLALAKR